MGAWTRGEWGGRPGKASGGGKGLEVGTAAAGPTTSASFALTVWGGSAEGGASFTTPSPRSFKRKKWQNLCVGDVVCLHKDNIVPVSWG